MHCKENGCLDRESNMGCCKKHYRKHIILDIANKDNVTKICSVDGCSGSHCAKGLCSKHYWRFQKYGDTNSRRRQQGECIVDGCYIRSIRLGYCEKHYQRMRKHGIAEAITIRDNRPSIVEGEIAKIPLGVNAKHGYTIVDREFSYLYYHKRTISCGNVVSTKNKDGVSSSIMLSHFIIGKPEYGYYVRHINGNKIDNRKCNLKFDILRNCKKDKNIKTLLLVN